MTAKKWHDPGANISRGFCDSSEMDKTTKKWHDPILNKSRSFYDSSTLDMTARKWCDPAVSLSLNLYNSSTLVMTTGKWHDPSVPEQPCIEHDCMDMRWSYYHYLKTSLKSSMIKMTRANASYLCARNLVIRFTFWRCCQSLNINHSHPFLLWHQHKSHDQDANKERITYTQTIPDIHSLNPWMVPWKKKQKNLPNQRPVLSGSQYKFWDSWHTLAGEGAAPAPAGQPGKWMQCKRQFLWDPVSYC